MCFATLSWKNSEFLLLRKTKWFAQNSTSLHPAPAIWSHLYIQKITTLLYCTSLQPLFRALRMGYLLHASIYKVEKYIRRNDIIIRELTKNNEDVTVKINKFIADNLLLKTAYSARNVSANLVTESKLR